MNPATAELSKHRCSLRAVWVGFVDFCTELQTPGSAPYQREERTFYRLPISLLFLPVVFALLALNAPSIAHGMEWVGSDNFAVGAALFYALGCVFLLSVPLLLLRRAWRFLQALCVRGQAVLARQAQPVATR